MKDISEPNMTNGKITLLLTASLAGAVVATAVVSPSVFFWNLIGLALLLVACRNMDDQALRAVTVVICVNMILMSVLYWGYLTKYGSPYFLGNSDDYNFDQYAQQVISEGLYTPEQIQRSDDFVFNNSISYICYLSWIVRISSLLGGYHPLVPRVLNIYYLSILCVLAYKYFQRHEAVPAAKSRFLIYCLGMFPNAIYVSIHNFRDVLSSLLLFLVFYLWDLFPQKKSLEKSLIVMATLFIAYWMFWLRSVTLLLIGLFILVSLLVGNRILRFKLKQLVVVAVSAIALVLVAYATDFFRILELYNQIYNEAAAEMSSGLSMKVFTMPLLPLGIWLRALYGVIIPVPVLPPVLDIDGFFQLLNSCGTIIQVLLLPYLILNFKTVDKIVIAFFALYGAIILTTFGFRHFIMLYPFMAIMMGRVFFKTNPACRYLFLGGMGGSLLLLIPVYVFLKS